MKTRYWQFYKSGLSILLMGMLLWACRNSQQNTADEPKEEKTPEDIEWENALKEDQAELPLGQQVETLLMTITDLHKSAFDSEQEKVNSSQLLINEIEQSMTSYNRKSLDSIKQHLALVTNSLYTEESMGDLAVMETYDTHTEALIKGWKSFRENNEEFESHARAVTIYEDILKADQSDQNIRTNYNRAVHDFNKLLEEHGSELAALDEKYKNLKPYVFFYGEDPVVDL